MPQAQHKSTSPTRGPLAVIKMRQLVLLVSILTVVPVFSQVSRHLDSTLTSNIKKLNSDTSNKYLEIYSFAQKTNFNKRIDTLKYTFAVIEINKDEYDSTFTLIEKYYFHSDSIPMLEFLDGEKIKLYPLSKELTLKERQNEFSNFKQVQSATYDFRQYYGTGCIYVSKRDKKTRKLYYDIVKNKLEHTYHIKALIDKKNNSQKVSIELPPKDVRLKLILVANAFLTTANTCFALSGTANRKFVN